MFALFLFEAGFVFRNWKRIEVGSLHKTTKKLIKILKFLAIMVDKCLQTAYTSVSSRR